MFVKVNKLTPEQLTNLYHQARQGSKEAKDLIILNHIPLVLNLLKNKRYDDELLSEAFWQLHQAVTLIAEGSIDHHESPNIGGYITVYVGGRLKNLMSRSKKVKYFQTKNYSPPDTQIEVDEILNKFPAKQRIIIQGRLAGKTDEEIGQEMGYTKAWVNKQRQEIQNDYRRLFQQPPKQRTQAVVGMEAGS
jgi:DNA-binding NarL/FixJ family response regulator